RPEFTAIISAATTTSQATPSPMRMPVTIWGSAAGSTTERKSRSPPNSKLRAARRYLPSIVSTPAAVPTTMGKNEERKIRKIGERSPTPNQRMASGIQAIGEIGRRPWTSGFRNACAVPNQPMSIPTGTASATARRYPTVTRNSEATTCLSRSPWRARSTRPAATCPGVGKIRLPLSTTATCQIATSSATGPSSGSQRPLPPNMNAHRARTALEALVHITLVGDALPDDAGLERSLHQVVHLGPDEPEVGVGDAVVRVGEHVPEHVRALVEDAGPGREVGGQIAVGLRGLEPGPRGQDVIHDLLHHGALAVDQVLVHGEHAAHVVRPLVARHVEDARIPGHLRHRAEGLAGRVGIHLPRIERRRHLGGRHLHQLHVTHRHALFLEHPAHEEVVHREPA